MKRNAAENPFSGRLDAFSSKLRRRGISMALVCGERNQKSLVGFGCDNGVLCVGPVPTHGRAVFYTDFRYIPAAKREAPWLKVVDIGRLDVRRLAPPRGAFKVGFEGSVPASRYLELQKSFGKRAKFVDVENDVLTLRSVKTSVEIVKMAEAEALNVRIWKQSLKEFRPGMTEKDMQRIIRAWMNALGDGEAFETIVCVGANAAECHHEPDDTVWRRGEPLLVDMGVKLDGYCSDMTRTVAVGHASEEMRRVYSIVLEAQLTGIAASRAGVPGCEIDAAARKVINDAGYGGCFGHGYGHSLGLDIHEAPNANPMGTAPMPAGAVVSAEPGIYLPGRFGVRIEDVVVMREGGCEVITKAPKELIVL